MKVILFDLYDTILKDISFDFEAGIEYLYKRFFSGKCTWEDMNEYSDSFLPLYKQRRIDNSEICLIKDEVPMFFKRYNVSLPEDLDALEFEIMNAMQKETILDEVIDTLEELRKRNISMRILSNSIFTGKCAEKLLESFGIAHYFEKIYSSADYKIRKPSSEFYQIAIDEILFDNSELQKKDIIYVGNDYITDVHGGSSAGLNVIWYNVKKLTNIDNLCIKEIDNFRLLLGEIV